MSRTVIPFTEAEIQRLPFCRMCNKDRAEYICLTVGCKNKDKVYFCKDCLTGNHVHAAIRIQKRL